MAPDLAGRLREFAATYPHLPLYSRICSEAAADPEVISLLEAAQPGQERPVLLLAALHDLVLRTPGVAAARWYTAVGGSSPGPSDDPWPDVRATLLEHASALRAVIATRSTQTNEVNRAVYVAALLTAAARDVGPMPVALVELGCSAGLLLGLDRFRISVGSTVVGDPGSPVQCSGSLRPGSTALVAPSLPPIVERVGLDLAPVSLSDEDEVRWLEACLWPDQPERLARFRAAVALLRPDPPLVVAGDMVDDLSSVAHSARAVATAVCGASDVHLVVMSNWALTYVRRDRRPLIASALADLAADGRPVSWITAEPPGAVPDVEPPPLEGETVLALRRWRAGSEVPPSVLGVAHPHAPWLHLL
ncbi:MAG TPA: DUF2332 domain-containing protein [Iamia sp.]